MDQVPETGVAPEAAPTPPTTANDVAVDTSLSHLLQQAAQTLPPLALLVIGFLENLPDPNSEVGIGCRG